MEKKYTDYDAINFAEDPSFIRWIRQKTPEASRFWEKWQSEHPDKQVAIREAKILVQAIQIKEENPSDKKIDALWDKIDAATSEKTTTVKKEAVVRPMRPMRWIGYAAAACLAGLVFFQFYNPATVVQIGQGEHLAYQFPDASKIKLNADSKISFKAKDWSKERVVELDGEAFFEVEKGVPFKVITPLGQVEVLGTSFNVNARDSQLIVACKTGKVRVTAKGDQEILTPGKGTKLDAGKTELIDVFDTDVNQHIGWMDGAFYLENVALSKVIEEIERQFDVRVKASPDLLKEIGDYTFKGTITEVLDQVTFQLNATAVVNGEEVIIERK